MLIALRSAPTSPIKTSDRGYDRCLTNLVDGRRGGGAGGLLGAVVASFWACVSQCMTAQELFVQGSPETGQSNGLMTISC